MVNNFYLLLEKHISNLSEYLNERASSEDIKKLESETGYIFPEAYKQLYLYNNGENCNNCIGIFMGYRWLSIDEAIKHWKNNRLYYDDSGYDIVSYEKNKVKEVCYHPDWFPVAFDYSGNYLGLDFSPGVNGIYGQVINYGRDERLLYVIGKSFNDFLMFTANQFESGNYKLLQTMDDDVFYISPVKGKHFVYDLKNTITNQTENLSETEEFSSYWQNLNENWKRAIKNNLQSEPNSYGDFSKIVSLNLLNSNIKDLNPLEKFRHLRKLIASGLRIEDFSAISLLTDLKELFIAKTPLSDLTPIRFLKNLQIISIGNTFVTDIHILSELHKIKSISLNNLEIDDLSPLRKCDSLIELDISRIRTKNIYEIGNLVNLKKLNIMNVPLKSLDFLSNMSNLKDLQLGRIENNDYSVLEKLQNIEYITCYFDAFIKTKDIFKRKVNYTICGEITDVEEKEYNKYSNQS